VFSVAPTLAAITASAVGLVLGLGLCTSGAAAGYVAYGLVVRPGALPAADLVARLYPTVTNAALAALGFVLLLTPTGLPPSPRWRWWTLGSAAAMTVLLVASTIAPGSLNADALAAGGPQEFRAFGGACGWPTRPPKRSPSSRSWSGRRRWWCASATPAGSSASSSAGWRWRRP
jgi:hypothetical protein